MFHTNKRKSQGLTIDLQCCTDSFPRRTICLRHCNFVDKTVSIIFTSTTHTTINSLLLLGNRFPQVCNVSRRPDNALLSIHCCSCAVPFFSLQCFSMASIFHSPRLLLPAFHTTLRFSFLHPVAFLIFKPLSYHVQL